MSNPANRVQPRTRLGVLLENARLDLGISTTLLMKRIGISRAYWYALLSGKKTAPSQPLLRAFSEELGIDMAQLSEAISGPPDNRDMWAGRTRQDARAMPLVSLVYLLFDGRDRLIYIGSTAYMHQRLGEHADKDYQGWLAYRCASRPDAYAREKELLNKHRPPLNGNRDWDAGVSGTPWPGPLPSQLINADDTLREDRDHAGIEHRTAHPGRPDEAGESRTTGGVGHSTQDPWPACGSVGARTRGHGAAGGSG